MFTDIFLSFTQRVTVRMLTFVFMFVICIPTSLTPMWHSIEDLMLLGFRLPVKKADPYTVNFLD